MQSILYIIKILVKFCSPNITLLWFGKSFDPELRTEVLTTSNHTFGRSIHAESVESILYYSRM